MVSKSVAPKLCHIDQLWVGESHRVSNRPEDGPETRRGTWPKRGTDVCWAVERGFDSDTRTPRAARQFVGSQLRGLLAPVGNAEAIDDAELLASELVTNAVHAGAGTVHVALELHHGELELNVTDDAPGWPTLIRPGGQDPHGRGLVLVDALADRWRAGRIDSGDKQVCVTIAVPAELTQSLSCDRPCADVSQMSSPGPASPRT